MNLGIALAMSQQFDWAIRAFLVAAELAPENPLPHRWLTKLYRRVKKDDDKAREHARIWAHLRKRYFEKTGRRIYRRALISPRKARKNLSDEHGDC